jgi:Antitoxin VbhA
MPVASKPANAPERLSGRTREDSVRFSIASANIEGLVVEDETKRLLVEWAAGRLSTEELIESAKLGLPANRVPGDRV